MSVADLYGRIVSSAGKPPRKSVLSGQDQDVLAEQYGIDLWHRLGDTGLKADEIKNAVERLTEVDGKSLAVLKSLADRAAEHIAEDG